MVPKFLNKSTWMVQLFNMVYSSILAILLLYSDVLSQEAFNLRLIKETEPSFCLTPDNRPGKCILLEKCVYLQELLKALALGPENIDFLRRSRCGIYNYNKMPKVCCPYNSNTKNTVAVPLPKPATNTYVPATSSTTTKQDIHHNRQNLDKNNHSICGRSIRSTLRIIGGENATLGDWPWIVAIGHRTPTNPSPTFTCGGTLISDRWVLTAGHCVANTKRSTVTIARVGELDLNEKNYDGASPVDILVERIIPHHEYKSNPLLNDIALLYLKNPATFTAQIRPICLPTKSEHKADGFYTNKSPFIAGWGYTQPRKYSSRSKILLEAQIDIVDIESCIKKYRLSPLNSSLIDYRVLCAGRRGVDSCQGDSGGPLVMPIAGFYHLIGIVSYGVDCANPFFPGVYTRVAYYFDWIKSTTGIEF